MPWAASAGAVISAWYPGQEMGNGLADVLWGDVNPSGRTPLTFPVNNNDTALQTPEQYPGVNGTVNYTEGLFVSAPGGGGRAAQGRLQGQGPQQLTPPPQPPLHSPIQIGYRWFDANGVAPLFPFGHGLSYTTFAYSGLAIDAVSQAPNVLVSAVVNNTGAREGGEIVQLYLGFPAAAGEPLRMLRGFTALDLPPGIAAAANFTLTPRDRSTWSVEDYAWAPTPGVFTVWLGASSRDLRLSGTFSVSQDGSVVA